MLVQYEATTKKSEPSVLVGEASTSKAKGKGARRWKRKKGKAKAAVSALSALVAQWGWAKVLERSRKLSRDEVVLKLGDGKAVAAEAVGIVHLVVSDQVRIELKYCYYVPSMIKNIISFRCWTMIKRLVDSKSLEIDDLDHLPVCESCLKQKMTKKPFVGQSTLASGLLDLIHSDVCGPLNTQARGEFSYSITFIDDHSWYGYVYLMRYKSEAFGRFKEFRLEVENQTGRKIKTLRSDRVRSIMSFIELPLSFWGYALETAAKLLNMAPSKTVAQTPYQIWHIKPTSYKYLRVWGSPAYVKRLVEDKLDSRSIFLEKGFPADIQREELLLEESSEATPQTDTVTSSAPIVPTNDIPVLRRSTRVSQQPERYGFLGLTGQLYNDPKTYGKAISDIDSGKWIEAMKSEMDSMSSNKVWTLVDPPKGVKLVV
ncbi:UNVERIFIED_CONTAM: hypothetical protein Sradi_6847100 [Sesamum radiatum]|uniref:Gag/pol protein n=1 Tax=Sesamum radiatum TaxID=300843 RepID=A0AAW2JMB8_SESRA